MSSKLSSVRLRFKGSHGSPGARCSQGGCAASGGAKVAEVDVETKIHGDGSLDGILK